MILQIIKFGIVGVIAAAADFGTLVVLKEFLHFGVLVSSAISFCLSGVLNYILSMTFVFQGKNQSKVREFIIFALLSTGGLILNQLILWIGISFTTVHYLTAKVIALIVVPVYNFITRKLFLESKEKV